MVSFCPGYSGDTTGTPGAPFVLTTIADADYLHREFIDLRLGNEFEFVVPFVSLIPWLQKTQAMGTLSVIVLNPLKAPDTVASSVTYTLEVAGAEDFEVFWPSRPTYSPAVAVPSGSELLEAQMETGSECRVAQAKCIGGSKSRDLTTTFDELCVGEAVRSYKQLMLRSSWKTASNGIDLKSFRPFGINPYVMTVGYPTTGFTDYYSLLTPLYAFVRGGVIVRAYFDVGDTSVAKEHSFIMRHVTSSALDGDIGTGGLSPFMPLVHDRTETNILAVHVPQYSSAFGRLVAPDYVQAGANYPYRSASLLQLNTGLVGDPAFANSMARCAADDIQCSFYLGPPLCFVSGV
jgi:hypothetical protein